MLQRGEKYISKVEREKKKKKHEEFARKPGEYAGLEPNEESVSKRECN